MPGRHCYGAAGNCTEPPAYEWTGPHGGKYLLCVQHCAEWREQAAATPLEPGAYRGAGAMTDRHKSKPKSVRMSDDLLECVKAAVATDGVSVNSFIVAASREARPAR